MKPLCHGRRGRKSDLIKRSKKRRPAGVRCDLLVTPWWGAQRQGLAIFQVGETPENRKTGKPENRKTGKPENRKTGKPENRKTGKP
jgi:hypothetical protein